MNDTTVTVEVMEAFKQRGFNYVGKSGAGWYRLHGHLIPSNLDHGFQCEIQIDPEFYELPRIRLLEIPPGLSATVPHLADDGSLCYIAKGSCVLDIFDPVGQSLACLERAASVFGAILKGEMVKDLAEEFFAYWVGLPCMTDIAGEGLGRLSCIVAESKGDQLWVITDNEKRSLRKLDVLGYHATNLSILTYRVRTGAQPRPLTNNWPPRKVSDILAWQGVLDPRCRNKILQRIQEGKRLKAKGVLIIIDSPRMSYGLAVLYGQRSESRKTAVRSQNSIYGLDVTMLSVTRIDDLYLAQRNIPALKTLSGKRIAVIGCGTIGGYLAEMLVKAGAGISGGQLTLVDFESLQPQNIGRHRLGFSHLFTNKAIAMADELKRLAPGAEVRSLSADVRQVKLGGLDLIIDATGEEGLGHWLCKIYLPHTPMLSVWIEGPGTAVRGLLRTNDSGACFRCLWHSNKRGEFRSVVGPIQTILAGHGCEGLYVPFPASVSVDAASLGTKMVLDWANDKNSPSLRTRLIDHAHQLATPDCDPPPSPDCPICNS